MGDCHEYSRREYQKITEEIEKDKSQEKIQTLEVELATALSDLEKVSENFLESLRLMTRFHDIMIDHVPKYAEWDHSKCSEFIHKHKA